MMSVRPGHLFAAIWIGWIVSWLAAALWAGRTEKRVSIKDAWPYRVFILGGALLLWYGTTHMRAERRLWDVGYDGAYMLAGVTLAGILIAWWARIHIGRLWSGTITRKEDHRVVDTGPYALVRHPIYTGLIAAICASAAAWPTVPSLAGAALITFGFWLKARSEERFLMTELGEDAYGVYRRRVPMLVPFLPRRKS